MRSLLLAAALFLPLSALAEVKVINPWVPEAPPNAQALAAFMVLENDGEQVVKVTNAWAPGFDTIELHRSVEENGMHKMIKQDALIIPAKGKLELKPGGYHVMLIGVHNPPKAGDVIPLRLDFEGLPSQTVEVPVKKRAEMMKQTGPMHGH
ncbi:MAG: copper chaperone PCu(A)C [Gammaproteobacteria bacterium]|nr:copper chaperone PCu(A)C [Gammaproteobacteria bacterium]